VRVGIGLGVGLGEGLGETVALATGAVEGVTALDPHARHTEATTAIRHAYRRGIFTFDPCRQVRRSFDR
jgi:hypothetical protein